MKARSKAAPEAVRPAREATARRKSSSGPSGSDASLQDRLAALERECDQLKAELERSQERQRSLEAVQAQVRDRLAWALDSLQSILQGRC